MAEDLIFKYPDSGYMEVWVKNQQRGIFPDTPENRANIEHIMKDEHPIIRKHNPDEKRSPQEIAQAARMSGMLKSPRILDPEKEALKKQLDSQAAMMEQLQQQLQLLTSQQNQNKNELEPTGTNNTDDKKVRVNGGQRKSKVTTK